MPKTERLFSLKQAIHMPLVLYSPDDSNERLGIQRDDTIVALDEVSRSDGVIGLDEAVASLAELEAQAEEALIEADAVETFASETVNVRAPIDPTKIVRIEGSYKHDLDDAEYSPFIDTEGLRERDWPRFWVVPKSTLTRQSGSLEVPKFAKNVKPGIELAFVLGRGGKYWTAEEGVDSIAGYLMLVDLGIYDPLPGQWGYRFFDGAMTFGSDLVSPDGVDLSSLQLSLELNGDELDSKSTSDWRFTPGEMVETVSQIMTLEPGDIITTGDPMRVHQTVEEGDTLRGRITDIGSVETHIQGEETDAEVLI